MNADSNAPIRSHQHGSESHRRDENENGSALIFALMFTTIVIGIVVTGTLTLKSQITHNRTLFITNYQAVMSAKSGLTEALSWMRRQTSQPVTAFEPVLDTVSNPQILDTEDPDIGLVRDFRISGNLWARYEVWKEWAGDPDPERLAWRNQFACWDMSEQKQSGPAGSAWRLRSVGYVYRQLDANVAFNEDPNVVLASELCETEILRAVINPPGMAALNVSNGSTCSINSNGRIRGNGLAGIYYLNGTGNPSISGGSVTGSPARSAGTTYEDSYDAVFGLSFSELSAMADQVVASAGDFPNPLPDNSLLIVDTGSTMTLDSSTPLTGTGVVIVNGNLTLNTGNNSLFTGMLYVDGNLTLNAPCEINGCVVCTGSVTVQGVGDYATINFDEAALESLMSFFGNYRRSNSLYLPRRGV